MSDWLANTIRLRFLFLARCTVGTPTSVEQNPLLARRLVWIAETVADPLHLAPFFNFWLKLLDLLAAPTKDWWGIGRVLRSMRRLAYAARLPRKMYLMRLEQIRKAFAGRQLWSGLGLDRLERLQALIEADIESLRGPDT